MVYWWSPASRKVRENASNFSISDYAKRVFAADCKDEGVRDGNEKRKRKLVVDEEWMASGEVVACCKKLNGGKKLPKAVFRRPLRRCKERG